MITPEQMIMRARIGVLKTDPFFATILCRLQWVPDLKMPHYCMTNGIYLKYNPLMIAELTQNQLECLLIHEAFHVAGDHSRRQRDIHKYITNHPQMRQKYGNIPMKHLHEIFNIAADLAINDTLLQIKGAALRELPLYFPGVPPFEHFKSGKPAEGYFLALLEEEVSLRGQVPDDDDDDDDDGESTAQPAQGGGNSSDDTADDEDDEPSDQSGNSDEDAEGDTTKNDKPQTVPDDYKPDLEPAPESEVGSGDQNQHDNMIGDAITAAKEAGNMPQYLEELIDAILKVQPPDWRYELRQFITRSLLTKRSYRKLNRRRRHKDFIIPYKEHDGLDHICFYDDMSGSMSDEACNLVYDFMEQIVNEFRGVKIDFVCFDTIIQHEQQMTGADFPISREDRKRYARGGTVFGPMFAHAERTQPVCSICLTDLECWDPYPNHPPTPFIWLDVNQTAAHSHYWPPFGKVLSVS